MAYTLGEAAKAVGKSKTTISRAIKAHKISASKNVHGIYLIEPAELHRIYPPLSSSDDECNGNDVKSVTRSATQPCNTMDVTAELQVKIAALEAKLEAATKAEEKADKTINDLRQRLDEESEERRKLTMMLTDQRSQPKKKRWFRRSVTAD